MDSSLLENQMRKLASSLSENQVQELLKLHESRQLELFLNRIEKNPGLVDAFIFDPVLEEPVQEYVSELEIRCGIIDRIQAIIVASDLIIDIHMALFAVVMVAPVDVLQSKVEMLGIFHHHNNQMAVEAILTQWQKISFAGIQAFANKGAQQVSPFRERSTQGRRPSQKSVPFDPRDPSASSRTTETLDLPSESPQARCLAMSPGMDWIFDTEMGAELCKERDDGRCCFTGMPDPVAAHIFPLVDADLSSIMAMLEIFWGFNTTNWIYTLLAEGLTESPQNMISLNRQLHWWFDNGRMALKPLRKTEDGSVTIQFHWLNESSTDPAMTIRGATFHDLMVRTGIELNQFLDRNVAHRLSGLPLETGQTFTFSAQKGPDGVPNLNLLKLSWDLRRAAAICGASREQQDEDHTETYEYNDDEEGHYDDEHFDADNGYDDQYYDVTEPNSGTWEDNHDALIRGWVEEIEAEDANHEKE